MKQTKKNTIRKAIITCGGYATRFLPITKAIPKEMLPIADKPVIHYIVQELKDAGITDILILIGRGRETLQNYFDRYPELEYALTNKKTQEQIDDIVNPFAELNITYRRVAMPCGSADNIYHAKEFTGSDPFVVAYCDDIFFEERNKLRNNPSIELVKDFELNKKECITVFPVPIENASNYGIVSRKIARSNVDESKGRMCAKCNFEVQSIIEKPKNPPSLFAFCGRFILTDKIYNLIQEDRVIDDEVCLVKQLNKLAQNNNLRAVQTRCRRFDTGDAKGLFEANKYYFANKN